MALLFPAGYQFFDSNGDPLASGTVTFYITDTETDKAAYSDIGMDTEIANPYSLDSSGRLGVNVYGAGTYTILLKTSAGATIFTRDDVFGWDNGGPVDIQATAGDTGDQSTALQAYLTDHRDLYLPAGTYRYATGLQIPASTTLRGPGKLHYTGTGNAIRLMGTDITLEDFTVYGDYTDEFLNGSRGIYGQLTTFSPLTVSYFTRIRMHNLTVRNFGQSGVRMDWIIDSWITNCEVTYCGQHGILWTSALRCHLDDNTVRFIQPGETNSGYGISLSRTSSATISGTPNTAISTTNAPVSRDCTIHNNVVTDVPDFVGIDLHSGDTIGIKGNRIRNCQVSINLEHATAGAETAKCDNIVIEGNTLYGDGTTIAPGILVDAQSGAGEISNNISIKGNAIYNHGLVAGGPFEGANGAAIYAINASNLNIDGNVFNNCRGRAIALDALADANIVGNSFLGVVSANSTRTAIELISATARAQIDANKMGSSGGLLFEGDAPDPGYGAWIGRNLVTGGAALTDSTSAPRARAIKLYYSGTYDPASMADGAGVETDVTVSGAILGDYARASFSVDTVGILLDAQVTAANLVTVRFQNESGAAPDLASGTLTVEVERATA